MVRPITHSRTIPGLLILVAALAAAPLLRAQSPQWGAKGVDLWTLPGAYLNGFTSVINNSGQVVGSRFNPETGRGEAAIFDHTTTRFLGTLGGSYSEGFAINNSGQVTGGSDLSGSGGVHAFLYDGTGMQDLHTLGGAHSYGYDINDSGKVTGGSDLSGGGAHAFLYDGTMEDLGTLGGTSSAGNGINTAGDVSGFSDVVVGGVTRTHAFRTGSTPMEDLGTLGGRGSVGYGINDDGQVTGYSYVSSGAFHAFRSDGTGLEDLGTLGGPNSSALGIDGSGRVIGWSDIDATQRSAAFWEGTSVFSLNSVVGDGWDFSQINGISDDGRFMLASGSNHGYNGSFYNGLVVLQTQGLGITRSDAILPTTIDWGSGGSTPVYTFDDATSGAWFDPASASAFDFHALGSSLFTEVGLPTGFTDPFQIFYGAGFGTLMGSFAGGSTVNFLDFIGAPGLSQFRIAGIDPLVDASDPTAFPVQLSFADATGNQFTMSPVVPTTPTTTTPEPASLALLATGLIGMVGVRRKRRGMRV